MGIEDITATTSWEEVHRIAHRELHKADRVYVESPSEAPKDAQVKEGPRGGVYYETEGGKEEPEKISSGAWMKDEPFTHEQVESFNRYSHWDANINREFKERINGKESEVKNHLKEHGVGELTGDINTALAYYRKAVYEYYNEHARAYSIAPPVSVVGPAKYQTQRIPKAQKIMDAAMAKIEQTEKRLNSAVSDAVKGKTRTSEKDKWLPLMEQAKSKQEFGKLYAEKMKEELKHKPKEQLTGYDQQLLSGDFDHVLRGNGRALYEKMMAEAHPKQEEELTSAEAYKRWLDKKMNKNQLIDYYKHHFKDKNPYDLLREEGKKYDEHIISRLMETKNKSREEVVSMLEKIGYDFS